VKGKRIRAVLLLISVALGAGCATIRPDVHSSAANAVAEDPPATTTTSAPVVTTTTTAPIVVSEPSTTSLPLPTGWRSAADIDALVVDVATPSDGLPVCLAGSPYGEASNDAAVLACLDDEAARGAYGEIMFERSDSVPLLDGLPGGFEEFQGCITTALSSQLVYDRLVEIATTPRYWGPNGNGDEVAADVIDRQFGSCWQRLALG
jgi:hypothetical protein